MRLEHKFVVPAPIEQTWAAFNDLERVVPCFPGATLTAYEGDEFTGSCKVKLGPVSLQYSGNGTFVERDAADHHAVIEAKGKDRRGNGTATARVTAKLTEAGPGSTEVSVDTDLTITGRPAQFGRGLIQDVSNKLLDQFTTCLKTRLDTPPTQSPPPTNTAPPADAAPPANGTSPADAARPADHTSSTGARRTPPSPDAAGPEPAAVSLDLGATVLPVLARRAAPYLIGAVLALLLRRLFRR